MSVCSQNARLKECPEEMVELIRLAIPHGSDVDDPIEDTAFLSMIGAKQRSIPSCGCGIPRCVGDGLNAGIGASRRIDTYRLGPIPIDSFEPEYELANAATGALFTFTRINYSAGHHWIILRGD